MVGTGALVLEWLFYVHFCKRCSCVGQIAFPDHWKNCTIMIFGDFFMWLAWEHQLSFFIGVLVRSWWVLGTAEVVMVSHGDRWLQCHENQCFLKQNMFHYRIGIVCIQIPIWILCMILCVCSCFKLYCCIVSMAPKAVRFTTASELQLKYAVLLSHPPYSECTSFTYGAGRLTSVRKVL